jgi:hypothetical protein
MDYGPTLDLVIFCSPIISHALFLQSSNSLPSQPSSVSGQILQIV